MRLLNVKLEGFPVTRAQQAAQFCRNAQFEDLKRRDHLA